MLNAKGTVLEGSVGGLNSLKLSHLKSWLGWIKSARSRLSGILKVEDPIQTLENRLKMASRFDLGDFYILREDDGSYTLRDAEAHYIYDSREPLRYKSGCVNGDAFHYESRSDAENPEWLKATRRTLDELFRMWEAPGTKEDNADGY